MTEWNPHANALLLQALEIADLAERQRFLDSACGADAALREQAESLLAGHEQAGNFLNAPHPAAAAPPDVPPKPEHTGPFAGARGDSEAQPGTVIDGRYKLLQQIGEGGMGTVWMADQTEPVKRRVAVKLIRTDRGSSKTLLARFEAERQAIALMDHPNIAKLLEAGTTEAGSPFFVMELVKGFPLTEYCDTQKLGIPGRLTLFMQICSAVQHAHQKGIIHRDLKPSNILVESHDGRPVPKVIDFGMAKATSGMQLTEKTLFTGFGNVAGTPLYMAPEQATFNAIDIDTRVDVYALGVILYELLTGTTPLTRETFKTVAFDEMLRLIREQEAPTPSSRLSSSDSKPTVAANRQTEPLQLGRFVKGELDWIVMKALAKERDRRYETANGFAKDIERFLKHEPVQAGPPSAAYRLRKFARRNRGSVVAAALVLLALAAGTALSLWQAVRATRAEAEAVTERDDKEIARQNEANQRILAQNERDKAKEASERLVRALYISRANLIQAAWEEHHFGRVLELLEQQRPAPGDPDLRDFEWHYFDRLCHADLHTVNLGSNSAIRAMMEFSAGGTPHCIAATTSEDDDHLQVKVINVTTGGTVFTVPEKWDLLTNIASLALSQDGTRLMVLTMSSGAFEGNLAVWDINTKEKVFSISANEVGIAALTPDGRRIAATVTGRSGFRREQGPIKIWDVNSKKKLLEIAAPHIIDRPIFTADGQQLVLLGSDGELLTQVSVVDPVTGKELRKQTYATASAQESFQRRLVRSIQNTALSPDGTRFIVIEGSQAIVWDTMTGKQLASFQPIQGERYSVVFSPDGQRVALWPMHVASAGQIWDLQTGRAKSMDPFEPEDSPQPGRLLKTIKGHMAGVVHLKFSADGTRLYSSDGRGTLKEWDAPKGAVPRDPKSEPIVKHSKDGSRQLVTQGGTAAEIHIRDAAGKELFTFTKHQEKVVYAEISANGRYVLSQDEAGGTKVWVTATGEILLERTYRPGRAYMLTMFSASGRRVAAALPEGGVKVWELDNFQEIFAKPDVAHMVQLSPDGQRLLTNHRRVPKKGATVSPWDVDPRLGDIDLKLWDVDLKLWDVDANKQLSASKSLDFAQFSPDGKWVALSLRMLGKAAGFFAVKVLDATTGAELTTFEVDHADRRGLGSIADSRGFRRPQALESLAETTRSEPQGLVFSPDSNRLAVRNGPDVLVWDIPARKKVFHLKGHVSEVDKLAFSPDGRRLASITNNRFDYTGFTGGRSGSRNGRRIALDHELILWDMGTGSELMRTGVGPSTHDRVLSFSPDGHRLTIRGNFADPNPLSEILDSIPRTAPVQGRAATVP